MGGLLCLLPLGGWPGLGGGGRFGGAVEFPDFLDSELAVEVTLPLATVSCPSLLACPPSLSLFFSLTPEACGDAEIGNKLLILLGGGGRCPL